MRSILLLLLAAAVLPAADVPFLSFRFRPVPDKEPVAIAVFIRSSAVPATRYRVTAHFSWLGEEQVITQVVRRYSESEYGVSALIWIGPAAAADTAQITVETVAEPVAP